MSTTTILELLTRINELQETVLKQQIIIDELTEGLFEANEIQESLVNDITLLEQDYDSEREYYRELIESIENYRYDDQATIEELSNKLSDILDIINSSKED